MAEILAASSESEVTQAIVTPSLRLVFSWQDDRWIHAVMVAVPNGEPSAVVHSIDRSAGERTVSPTYQQVHLQADAGVHHAMLVGQSGNHHFSATFTVREEENGVISIDVDVADRRLGSGGESEPLACTYDVRLPLAEVEEASHRFIRWWCSSPAGHLNVAATDSNPTPTIVMLSESRRDGSLVQPIARFVADAPTQRCRYRWTWEPARPTAS
jgi:hypothetical protein